MSHSVHRHLIILFRVHDEEIGVIILDQFTVILEPAPDLGMTFDLDLQVRLPLSAVLAESEKPFASLSKRARIVSRATSLSISGILSIASR